MESARTDEAGRGDEPRAGGNGAPLRRQTFTVPEAAALLGISRAKAYQCVHSGEIRAVQFGRRIVVPASVIEELLGAAVGAA